MRSRFFWGATGLGLVALFVAFRFVDLERTPGFDLCLFHGLSGLACPNCGMTRAVAAWARGDFRQALELHPMAPLVLAEVGLVWFLWGRTLFTHHPFPHRFAVSMIGVTAALLLVLWVVRAACGWLPP